MSELFNAREQSHATRQQVGHKVYITGKGASYTPPPPPPPPSFKYQLSRGIIGGLRDTAQGAIDIRNEVASILEPFAEAIPTEARDAIITSLMGFTTPRADDSVQEVPSLPEVDAPDAGVAEGLLRGLVQFGAGAAAAPIKGAGMVAQMGRGAVADALFDPEDGNLSTMLKEFGLEGAVLDFLDSQVDGDAGAEERLQARVMQSLEGAGLGALVDGVMAGFRLIRSNKEAVEEVKEALAEAAPPTDTQVMPDQSFFDKAGEATDRFVTQAATTTDEVATNAARATDEFVSPNAQTPAGQVAPGDLSKQIDDARAAYEAAPNDPQLRLDYFDLRKQRDADPVAQVQPPTDAEPGIIAFHGSAADFDQFRLEKIGTGEGAQAYGYGLYFADKEAIADFYRGALTDAPFDYKIDGQSVSKMYRDAAYADNHELADVLEQVQLHDTPKTLKAKFTVENGYTQETADFVADLDYTKLTGVDVDGKEIPLGRIYKVGLTPKPDDLLDYDKPLSSQSENVQAAFKKVFYNNFIKGDADLEALFASPNALSMQDMGLFNKSTGAQAYRELADRLGKTIRPAPLSADGTMMPTEQIASNALFEAGIPGIKFADNDSRSQQFVLKLDVRGKPYETEPIYARNLDDAKRIEADYKEKGFGVQIDDNRALNYVIFDDSMIKILEKYGIVGPVAISAAAASKGGQKDDET